MATFSTDWNGTEFGLGTVAIKADTGPMIEVVVGVDADQPPGPRDLADLRARLMAAGASYVRIEVHDQRPVLTKRTSIRVEDAPDAALEQWLAAQNEIPMEPTLTVGKELIASTMSGAAKED